VNVNGDDAINMLRSYVEGKSNLIIVDSADVSNYTFILSIYELNMGNRKGKIDIMDSKSQTMIFESKWVKGVSNVYSGFSGSRGAIMKIFKGQVLKKFPTIEKQK